MIFCSFEDFYYILDGVMVEISPDGFYESGTSILKRFNFPNRDLSK